VTRPRLLDLFCGAGGVAMGYHRAGFDVVGVDINPQPHYPFEFHQADALTYPLDGFDAIHASPVCKAFSQITRTAPTAVEHPDQITPIRPRLEASGLPYVIENVPGAPLVDPILLCGSMFDLDVQRHRLFETNWGLTDHYWPCRHGIWAPRYHPNRSDRKKRPGALARVISVAGHGNDGPGGRVADWRRAMGIDWMTRDELAQAIPPVYTEWVGAQLLRTLEGVAA
jgi:DNA (cytosine-5)-methyltransferase 1